MSPTVPSHSLSPCMSRVQLTACLHRWSTGVAQARRYSAPCARHTARSVGHAVQQGTLRLLSMAHDVLGPPDGLDSSDLKCICVCSTGCLSWLLRHNRFRQCRRCQHRIRGHDRQLAAIVKEEAGGRRYFACEQANMKFTGYLQWLMQGPRGARAHAWPVSHLYSHLTRQGLTRIFAITIGRY